MMQRRSTRGSSTKAKEREEEDDCLQSPIKRSRAARTSEQIIIEETPERLTRSRKSSTRASRGTKSIAKEVNKKEITAASDSTPVLRKSVPRKKMRQAADRLDDISQELNIGEETPAKVRKGAINEAKKCANARSKMSASELEKRLKCISEHSELFGYQKQVTFLRTVLRSCVGGVDSNSVLVYGSHGSGKSTLVEHCLAIEEVERKATVLRLNGCIDASEVNALRFIGQSMDIKETDLPQMMAALRDKCEKEKKGTIIILDEFDIFCRKNQTMLYNLFDLTQKCTYICIIGMTTRLDCIELLEKRVKSRMNQAIIHLTSPFQTFADFAIFASKLFTTSQASLSSGSKKATKEKDNFGPNIPPLLATQLKQLYSKTKSVRGLKRCLISFLAESQLMANEKNEKDNHVTEMTSAYIGSLSFLELSVLLLAAKYTRNKNEDTFNCNALTSSLHEIPAQMSVTKCLLLKIINNLISYSFIVHGSALKNALYLTEWTPLVINVKTHHLKQVLAANESTIPIKLQQLLNSNG